MIVTLKTDRSWLMKIFDIWFIGPFFIFLIAAMPIPLMFILNALFQLTDDSYIERINALIVALWNTLLSFGFRIHISIFFIPCWLLFLIIGTLRYYHIIG